MRPRAITAAAVAAAAFAAALAAGMHRQAVYHVDASARARNAERSGVREPAPFGFTAFPYDFTAQAVATTRRIVAANSTLWAVHLDNGIPWRECLDGAPLPARIRKDWDDQARAIPPGRPVYLGIAPLDTDRKSLAPATGEQQRVPMPPDLSGKALDDPAVERAYVEYARLAIQQFHPRYLNLGIEAGELMSRDMSRWPAFVRLYRHTRAALKREFQDVQMGISFGLGELRLPREAEAAKPLIADSDYVGLSFYPYASAFDERFGAPPYRGAEPWREPLDWVRAYTDKPIALCETGFTSQPIDVPQYGLKMDGSLEQQAAYVRDLFHLARRDRYLFVVWFCAVDYDPLYARLPPGSDAMKLWRNIGLYAAPVGAGEPRPKPALAAWQAGLREVARQRAGSADILPAFVRGHLSRG